MADLVFVPLDAVLGDQEASRHHVAMNLLYEAARALAAMHASGIVHGDLRCENILVAPELKTVKLGGLAHSFDWNALRFRVTASNTTPSELGLSVSSARRWLAPECVAGSAPSPASDVYSFGLTVYEALTGSIPFGSIDDAGVVELKKMKDTQLPDRCSDKIHHEAWSLIQDACHHNPIFRPSAQITMMSLRSLKAKTPVARHSATRTATVATSTLPHHVTANMPTARHPSFPNVTLAVRSPPKHITVYTGSVHTPATEYADPAMTPLQTIPTWKKVASVVVGVLLICAIVVPIPLLMGSPASSYSDATTTPTATPSYTPITTHYAATIEPVAPDATPTPIPMLTPTPTPTPAPTPEPTLAPAPVLLPVRVPLLGYRVETLLHCDPSAQIVALAVGNDTTIYASDGYAIYRFREDSPLEPTLVAGSSSPGYTNGPAEQARFGRIVGLAIDKQGNMLVADDANLRVRKVRLDTQPLLVEDVAGDGTRETRDGALQSAAFSSLWYIAFSTRTGIVFVTGYADAKVRTLDINRDQVTMLPPIVYPVTGLVASPTENEIYLALDSKIIRMPPDGSSVSTIAGSSQQGYRDDFGTNAEFNSINGLAISRTGEYLYVADTNNNCIRMVHVATQQVTTLAGMCGTSSDQVDGDIAHARFARPSAIAVGPDDVVYVAEAGQGIPRLRRIQPDP